MLSSHMDVVDVDYAAGWKHDPFAGEVDGGCLHGRGAMGPLAIQVHAASRLARERPAGDILAALRRPLSNVGRRAET
jgi:acetylornithine deacetylase/succinyl-diaminopimelate desuccinylase-like protein